MAWFVFYPFAIQASKVVFAATVLVNICLIYLTKCCSKKITGPYKFMIMVFAVVGILFTFLKATLHPYLHSHNSGLMLFSLESGWGHYESVELALMVYTGVYSVMMSFVAIQFVYRYWILFCSNKLVYFNTWRCVVWFGYVLLIGMGWTYLVYCCTSSDHYSKNYMRTSLFEAYGKDVEKSAGFFIIGYNQDNSIRWRNVAFIYGLLFDILVQYVIMIYCGSAMSRKIDEKLANFSTIHRRLHKQLFKTLVLQITVPSILFHLPIIPVLCAPLFDFSLDFESGMIYSLFSLYPLIDSGILMFVVHEYRNAITSVMRTSQSVAPRSVLKRFKCYQSSMTVY